WRISGPWAKPRRAMDRYGMASLRRPDSSLDQADVLTDFLANRLARKLQCQPESGRDSQNRPTPSADAPQSTRWADDDCAHSATDSWSAAEPRRPMNRHALASQLAKTHQHLPQSWPGSGHPSVDGP